MIQILSLVRPMADFDLPALCGVVAAAFTGRDGTVPLRYQAKAVRERLEWSLASAADGGPITLVACLADTPVALGQYAPARWAASSWELTFGATLPDLQAKGIGHALVMARLAAIEAAGGGVVFVSAKKAARWRRYGFEAGPFNPLTGATAFWRFVGGGR